MSSRRLFIAVDISDEARRLAAEHIDNMRPLAKDVRVSWERPEKLHVTLKFLGNVFDGRLGAIDDAVALVAQAFESFEMAIAGTGVFPNARQPRVLWLGIEDANAELNAIAHEVDQKLSDVGFESESRRFSPHLTIARIREPQKAERLAEAHLHSRFRTGPFAVTEIVLYQSELGPTGSVYTKLGRSQLRNRTGNTR